jgi:hypothetical protein
VGLILTLLAVSLTDARRIRRKARTLKADRHDHQQAAPAFAVTTDTARQDSRADTEELPVATVDPPSDDSDDKVLMNGSASDTH